MKKMKASQFAVDRQFEYGTPEQNETVQAVIRDVQERKDAALLEWTEKFDRVRIDQLKVSQKQIDDAYGQVDEAFLNSLRKAMQNIRVFHEKQKRSSWMDLQPDGTMLGQVMRPLKRVGVYVPGGKAAYPSSVLMNVIPAQVAGVEEIVMVTPPASGGVAGIHPAILVAANELGIREIYGVGGAQAIAALAYGTETIQPVDKICGPGNIFVALAKRYVYGAVAIDSIAGPTDIVVFADGKANPEYVAADMLSQAEHDEMASAILVTDSQQLAQQVEEQLEQQLSRLQRREIAQASLDKNGAILIADSLEEGMQAVNRIAPEHLELMVEEPLRWLGRVENAGAIFMGPYSSEPVGDYFAGPNHILPTNGTARFSSPLNVDDFMKKSSVIYFTKEALLENGEHITRLAYSEGLEAHAKAIEVRLRKEGNQE
ncbi:histidinol dehydrogenase [Marinicrinis lubricantis]|uniref:Histidinol dehydrogenase n=1 Tax=Marinicrinis lubricantis TaxID=2086470 RepID=A0ABW1IPM1_9BACL